MKIPQDADFKDYDFDSNYWVAVAKDMVSQPHYLDDRIGEQKRQAHLKLIREWIEGYQGSAALKTDLFEEAFGPDHLISELRSKQPLTIGMDISTQIVNKAREKMKVGSDYVVCDVRALPFVNASLDLIVSTSTLDHFATWLDIGASLNQLTRSLKQGGILIVTLDNGTNILNPLMQILVRMKLMPYHIGPTLSIEQLVGALEKAGLQVTNTTALIHNPRIITTVAARSMRVLFPSKADRWVAAMLRFFERFEGRRSQYYTGCFIAARATKAKSFTDGYKGGS